MASGLALLGQYCTTSDSRARKIKESGFCPTPWGLKIVTGVSSASRRGGFAHITVGLLREAFHEVLGFQVGEHWGM